ncbi:MAG: hypothetical protein E2O41_07115 [Nitrospina sp.]|nr:MAG: hypothetical protein E2O41_07115 [Nitrospina sp.]
MVQRIDFKAGVFLTLLTLIIGGSSQALAHGGHQHEDGPGISLPQVLAQVNGADIKKESVWNALTQRVKKYKARGMALTREQERVAAQQLVEDQINLHLFLQKAKALGITVSEEQARLKLADVKSGFKSEKAFQKKLEKKNISLEQYRKKIKEDLLVDGVIQKEIREKIQITDSEAQQYFEKNKSKFSTQEKRRASVILIKVDSKNGGDREARKTLEKIQAKLQEGGDFGELARQFSQDTLAKRGGDLGFFTQDRMFAAFSKRAFKLKVGEVSDVFQTRHGLQILKVTGKKEASTGTLEGEKENIRKILTDKKTQKQKRAYLQSLRKNAKIKIYF